jgi:gas vesicle protein
MNKTGALLGFLIGAAAGAAIGILYAPDKGVDTRHKIKDKAQKTTDDLKVTLSHKIDELSNFISRFADDTKAKVSELERKSQQEVKETKANVIK